MDFIFSNLELVSVVVLFFVGYFAGSWAEASHYRSIEEREEKLRYLPAMTFTADQKNLNVLHSTLVVGNVVIANDYFKRILAWLRNIFGGRVSSYETLVDRARREAVLRMKEQATDANMIVNVRIETSSIGQNTHGRGAVSTVEAIAYGTALKLS